QQGLRADAFGREHQKRGRLLSQTIAGGSEFARCRWQDKVETATISSHKNLMLSRHQFLQE
ncbi:hypothetical protein, partial [Sinorhizobium sp. CCBAU 05631]|uniref:hypothetical protein n=1 Tax=Sinorhizobium sp. CCBAU 05631 TaxID=794846 RepID=UPI001AEC5EFA